MRIAVAYDNGEIYGHFGNCAMFAVYDYEDNTDINSVKKVLVDSSDRHGHRAMAALMHEQKIDAVIAGNMGAEAKSLLLSMCIVPVVGYCGDADTAADMLVTGSLPLDGTQTGGCGGGCGGCGGGCHHEEGGDCGCGGGCHN